MRGYFRKQFVTTVLSLGAVMMLAGCLEQSDSTAFSEQPSQAELATTQLPTTSSPLIFVGNDAGANVAVITHRGDIGNTLDAVIGVGGDPGDIVATKTNHVFVNVTGANLVAAIDPIGDQVLLEKNLAAGIRPVHSFLDPEGTRVWVMNDGDREDGVDSVNCSGSASVTVIQNHGNGAEDGDAATTSAAPENSGQPGEVVTTLCVGRGHHKATFSFPSDDHPDTPHRTFVSNIKDGTVSVIDNDPESADYLTVIATLDLCDATTDACDDDLTTANGSIPHGIDFSPHTGKVYNANVGYGTVSIIDPLGGVVESVIDVGFANKAHVSPNGHFLVVKGNDTSDANHITGKLAVVDLEDESFFTIDIPNVYPDSFLFTPDGTKLYVASAHTSGTAEQEANLKRDVLIAFDFSNADTSDPLSVPLVAEIVVGATSHSHRALAVHAHGNTAKHVFVPNADNGTVSVVNIVRDEVTETIPVGGEPSSIMVYQLEESHADGHGETHDDDNDGSHTHGR